MLDSELYRGLGGFVLKEKIKGVKQRLKAWNQTRFGDTQHKLRRIELELNKLENEGDERQWNDQEAAKTIAGGFVGNNSFT